MVDEVDIKNVGGKYGVASEATMQLILAQLGGASSAAGSRAQRLADASRDRSTRSTNDNTAAQGLLAKSVKGTIGAVGGFASALLGTNNRISDFSKSILGESNMLSRGINMLTGYIDDNIDSLRELSSVGASFNNSIFDMRLAATAGEMSFTDFSKMVKENSNTIAMLGGTVSKGAEQISLFTKGIRKSDAGKQLMGMGFTIADINEGLTDYLEIQLQSGNKINLRDKKLTAGGEAYLRQLDDLAKVTGKSRDQISKDLIAQQQDAGIRNRVNELTGDQQRNFTSSLEYINTTLPGLAPGLRDMMDGVAQTPLGQILQSQIQGLGPLMEKVYAGQISEVDFNTQLKKLQPEIDKFQSQYSKEMLDSMRAGGGMGAAYAEAADAAYQFNTILNQSAEELKKEYDQRNKLTELFGNFSQTVESARSKLYDSFVTSEAFKALEKLGAKLLEMVTPGSGTMDTFSAAIDYVSEFMLGKDGVLTNAINFISTEIDEFAALVKEGGFLHAFETKLSELGSWIANWFKEIFYGKEVSGRDRQSEHQKGLLAQMGDGMISAFTQFWEGPYGSEMANKIIDYFADVAAKILQKTFGTDGIIDAATGGVAGYGGTTSQIEKLIARMESGETLTQEELDQIVSYSAETGRAEAVAKGGLNAALGRTGQVLGGVTDWGVDAIGTGMDQDVVYQLAKKAVETQKLLEEKNYDLTTGEQPEGVVLDPSAGFANGTRGFENFGSVTGTSLHGVEAVVPRNTMAGNMLAKTFGDDWNNPKANTQGQGSQENTAKYIIQLNSTMLMVLDELRKGTDLDKRTLNSVRSLSGDLNRGI